MRLKLFNILTCFFLMLNACKNETKISFSEINYTTDFNKIVEINIPKAKGNKNVVKGINEEIERLVVTALQVGDPDPEIIKINSIAESINSFNKEFDIFKKDYPEAPQSWEAQIDGEVLFQSHEIISIAITVYQNTGGASGNTTITFLNFEAESGNRISNNKLISNLEKFKETAKIYFDEAIKNEDVLIDSETFQLPENIAYNNEGVVLLYNTYEVAPYSTGIIDFTIPFEEIESNLTFNSL